MSDESWFRIYDGTKHQKYLWCMSLKVLFKVLIDYQLIWLTKNPELTWASDQQVLNILLYGRTVYKRDID